MVNIIILTNQQFKQNCLLYVHEDMIQDRDFKLADALLYFHTCESYSYLIEYVL